MGNMIKNLAQAKTDTGNKHQGGGGHGGGGHGLNALMNKKPHGSGGGDEPIINNNSKHNYPRVGKMDREGQILEDGKVETFVKRANKIQKTQNKATERLKEIHEERRESGHQRQPAGQSKRQQIKQKK